MEKGKNNLIGVVIVLLIVIILILGVLCYLFATGTISINDKENELNSNTNTVQTEEDNTSNLEEQNESSTIVSKLVENVSCGDSELSFNDINISLKEDDGNGNMICVASEININGINIKSEIMSGYILTYEIFDNNVILNLIAPSYSSLYIYNVDSKSIVFDGTKNSLKDYKVNSFSTNNNTLTINTVGCGAQCGLDNDGEATFESTYENNQFSEPVEINN